MATGLFDRHICRVSPYAILLIAFGDKLKLKGEEDVKICKSCLVKTKKAGASLACLFLIKFYLLRLKINYPFSRG